MEWTGILLSLPWIAVAVFILQRWTIRLGLSARDYRWLLGCLAAKLIGSFVLQGLYTYYYTDRTTADIYRFFDDGMILRDIAFTSPRDFLSIMIGIYPEELFRVEYFEQMNSWIKPYEQSSYNDNHTMIRYNGLLGFVSLGYYEVHSVITTILSFFSLMLISSLFSRKRIAFAMILFTLMPGILIWTSGVLKESLVMIGISAGCWALLANKSSLRKRGLLFILSAFVLLQVKPYFLAALLPAFIALWLSRNLAPYSGKSFLKQWGIWLTCIAIGFGSAALFNVDLLGAVSQKQNDFLNHAEVIKAGSMVSIERLDGSFKRFIMVTPTALKNALIEPLPWNFSGLPSILMMLENILFLGLLALALFQGSSKKNELALFLGQFALPVILLIGFTTPVLGAIMRYRAPIMVLLVLLLLQYLPPYFLNHAENDSKN